MVKSELIKRSPLRLLEKSIHGGVGSGKIGVVASRKGVGKTAFLVHLSTDRLFQGKHVIHVSFAGRTDHIISWYEDIFKEIARKRNLDNAMEVHDDIIKNRVIMNFNQQGVEMAQVVKSISAMVGEGQFRADLLVIDGYNFEEGSSDDLATIRNFAAEQDMSVWISADLHRDDPAVDEHGVPAALSPFMVETEVLITVVPEKEAIKLSLLKDHANYVKEDLHLLLDPKSLLIAEE